jgi:hypothetical protein
VTLATIRDFYGEVADSGQIFNVWKAPRADGEATDPAPA